MCLSVLLLTATLLPLRPPSERESARARVSVCVSESVLLLTYLLPVQPPRKCVCAKEKEREGEIACARMRDRDKMRR